MRTSNTRTTHRRRLPKPDRCAKTGKVRWPDSRAAVEVLHLAKNSATKAQADGIATRRQEVRHYKCCFCNGFHTTSQAEYRAQA